MNCMISDKWFKVELSEIIDILDLYRIPVNSDERHKRIFGRQQDELYPYYGATGIVGQIDDFLFNGEYILLGEDGAPFLDPFKDKAYIANGKFWVNNHAHIMRSYTSNKFYMYFLNTISYHDYVSGTTRLKLNQASLKQILCPLPPLPEQRAIVSKIEQLFSDLDNGIDNLKTAKQQIKVYRQAVLKKAFEGELTREWRAVGEGHDLSQRCDLSQQIQTERKKAYNKRMEEWNQKVKEWVASGKSGKKPVKPSEPKQLAPLTENILPELPEGWGWIKLGIISEEPKYGTSKKCDYHIDGIGVLRIPNIGDNIIDDSDMKYAEFDEDEISTYDLKEGDILIIRSNGSVDLVGKTALIRTNDIKYLFAGYLIRLRPISDYINSNYLINCLSSVLLRNQIESVAKSTSGVNNINSNEIMNLLIPLCPLPEQNQIVQEIETRFSVCDNMEKNIDEALQKADALRQSILKKAFEGRLLTDEELEAARKEPDWEPAEKLLEKIKKEKKE